MSDTFLPREDNRFERFNTYSKLQFINKDVKHRTFLRCEASQHS